MSGGFDDRGLEGRLRARATLRLRGATARARVLPDFLVLGGSRCGSTSLFTILCAHPQVLPPHRKETRFFDNNPTRGLDHYRRFFPIALHRAARARRLRRPVLTGEGTALYLFHAAVPARVAAALPQARLVALVRDPVDRAYSHYKLAVRNGRETLAFEEALDAEPERLAGEEERLLADPSYRSWRYGAFSYTAQGRYLPQLERWHAHVPRERLLVLRSEDLFERPRETVAAVTAFLGLDAFSGELPAPRNRATYEAMRPETRERLRREFQAPNRALERYLGRALDWQRPALSEPPAEARAAGNGPAAGRPA